MTRKSISLFLFIFLPRSAHPVRGGLRAFLVYELRSRAAEEIEVQELLQLRFRLRQVGSPSLFCPDVFDCAQIA